MNNKNIFLLIIIVIKFSCSCKHEYHSYTYYESGEIKEEYIYKKKSDTLNFVFYEFYKNGNYKKEINVRDGKKEGHFIKYYENGIIQELLSFKNDTLHGPYRKYNKEGLIEDEFFHLYGQNFIYKMYGHHPPYVSFLVYKKIDETKGALKKIAVFNFKNDKVVKDTSDYYYTYTEDTIAYKKANNFKVECYNEGKSGYHVKLVLGELNKNLKFIDSTKTKIFESNDMTIQVPYKPVKKGVDLLTGKLYLINDSTGKQEREFLYYHEFYVK